MSVKKDCTGRRFGRLVVINWVGTDKWRHSLWECKCDCGNTVVATANNLRSGNTRSCGCKAHEQLVDRNSKHGESKTRLYRIWRGIHTRCENKNRSDSKYYAMSGITVCDEWHSYDAFKTWSVEHGYNDSLSIDRIDNDRGYCPENCRWVTHKQQCNNRRNNIITEYRGQKMTLAEYSDAIGVPYSNIYRTISKGV